MVMALEKYGFCPLNFQEKWYYCNQVLEVAVPTALPLIGEVTEWIPKFCEEQMKCEKWIL